MSRKDMNLSFFKAFQVMFSYKIKSGELINDLEKKWIIYQTLWLIP